MMAAENEGRYSYVYRSYFEENVSDEGIHFIVSLSMIIKHPVWV